ncbi:EamA family transporter [Candidatus Chloroploca sp. M-50]|uniref:EamA family transporter n=1 Tax=Candidatus Chloroploca mongolica TaxID=2528176 RepID=A0ABS4D7G6_9CHLR|nr:EamA family transporter [Candidatus Chloroploca mongolica]MBP1465371.1 EamA family transporter [Candidatus Chloroploca mongolica]
MQATTPVEPGVRHLSVPVYTSLALTFSFLWSTGFIAVAFALRSSPPLFLMGLRFVLSGGVLLLIVIFLRRSLPRTLRDWLRLGVLGILSFAFFFGFTATALQGITAGTGAVLASTNPLMLAFVAPFLLGERLGLQKFFGLALAFVSVVFLMSARMGTGESPFHMALVLVANISMVAGTILFKRWALPYDLAGMNAIQLLVGGVALLIPSFLWEPVDQVIWDTNFIVALIYMCIMLSWVTMLLYLFLVRHGDASRANTFLFLTPVFGLVLGALLLGDPLRPIDALGATGVALGIWLVMRSR